MKIRPFQIMVIRTIEKLKLARDVGFIGHDEALVLFWHIHNVNRRLFRHYKREYLNKQRTQLKPKEN